MSDVEGLAKYLNSWKAIISAAVIVFLLGIAFNEASHGLFGDIRIATVNKARIDSLRGFIQAMDDRHTSRINTVEQSTSEIRDAVIYIACIQNNPERACYQPPVLRRNAP